MLEAEEVHHKGPRSHTRSRSSVSNMLGQLFSKGASLLPLGGSPTSSRPPTSLESVQEDIYTRNLLFPDAEALYQHQHDQVFPLGSSTVPLLTSSSNAFDLNPEVDLDLRDVRVVVMQEATSMQNSAALLFDSQALTEPPQSPATSAQSRGAGSGRSITSPRRISLGQPSKPVVITQDSAPRAFGAFDRRPSTHTRTGSYVETDGQRSAREYREEMTTFSNCIFGSSDIMAYKGTGTKVHIIPTESRSSSYPFDGHGSVGRSSMRSSKLAQSYTSENIITPASAGLPGLGSGIRTIEKKKVLITRIFPVPLPNIEADEVNPSASIQQGTSGSGGYPFPALDGKNPATKPKQKRTPMYAIGLIVQLPATTQMPSAPASRSGFRTGSFNDQESYPSSYSSLKPSGWTVLGGFDSLDSSYSDIDDRIDAITQHWDVIMRTLSHLQAVVSESVLALLKQADAASPSPIKHNINAPMKVPSASISVSGKRVEENFKPHKLAGTNAKLVQLMPHSLAYNQQVKTEIDTARQRIVSGIKAQQVITRQGRWGIWREEARWVAKWAGGKEQAFFFYNLLTGFLGVHTEWLQALGPTAYRRHYYQQQRSTKDEDVPISARTVIVAQDKMAARRLLFLLSAFLPPNQQHQTPLTRMHRPSTATSYGGGAYSQSPPSYVPTILREESLRRKVNRRNAPSRSGHARTMSIPQSGHDTHDRRGSDAMSLKTANLPIPGSDGGNGGKEKSSAATTTTVTPATTTPHFSTRRLVRGTGPILRPGSSGSLATDDLMRSLKRGDSSGQYSNASSEQGYSRWGSVISTLWGNKRRGSTNETDITVPDLAVERKAELKDGKKGRGKLAEMVEEAHKAGDVNINSNSNMKRKTSISYSIPELPKALSSERDPSATQPAPYISPAKSAVVGVDVDGCIDIDVPLPPFLSFGSPFSSPSSSGYLSAGGMGLAAGLEGFEHYSGADSEGTMNVAGWLPRYHPDFALQAIPSQSHEQGKNNIDALENDIKASMKMEPTPFLSTWSDGEESRWVTVSTALIADTTNWTIKRVTLRRKVAVKNAIVEATSTSDTQSIYGNPYDSAGGKDDLGMKVLEEEFVTDACVCVDEGLVGAVEKVVAWPEASSDNHEGPASSPATSQDREREREGSDSTAIAVPTPTVGITSIGDGTGASIGNESKDITTARPESLNLSLKVPKAKVEVPRGEVKGFLLGALEEVAREVAEGLRQESEQESEAVEHEREKESFLREGVRGWLEAVDGW